jgi:hypothetical protein
MQRAIVNVIREDIKVSEQLSDYDAFDILWKALVKVANEMEGKTEFKRMKALIKRIPDEDIMELLTHPAINILLTLDPPIETTLVNKNERLETAEASREAKIIKNLRKSNPREALKSLGSMLKRIRNKVFHGFKSRGNARNKKILGAARPLLLKLCHLGVEVINISE